MLRTRLTILTAATTLAGLALVPAAPAAEAAGGMTLSSFDARLLADINAARRHHGLAALSAAPGTSDVAHNWSCHMSSHATLSHHPDLSRALVRHGSSRYRTYGENVGAAGSRDADTLFAAYMRDAGHRENILGASYRFVGIHTKYAHGYRWNVLDFVDEYNSAYGATRSTC